MAAIELREVSLHRGESEAPSLDRVDLWVDDGELVAVVGPSGAGKSSLLHVIAGLEAATSGSVWFDGKDVSAIAPQRRGVGMVFQEYALYGRKTAGKNIEFPLEVTGIAPEERRSRVRRQAELAGIGHLLDRYPFELSAGGRQAIATARALIKDDAAVLLMDEPLAHLDTSARSAMRVELKRMHHQTGATIVYVTNDDTEAMAMGDRVVVLDGGRVQQAGSPRQVYAEPANRMVATFMGTPSMQVVPGELTRSAQGLELLMGTDRVRVEGASPGLDEWVGRPIEVGIRPEHLRPAPPGADFHACLHGTVLAVEDTGSRRYAFVDLGLPGVQVAVRLDRTIVAVDHALELAVAIDHLTYFDPLTGNAIR